MFKDCNDLTELNRKKIEAVQSGGDLVAINNAYNARRQELLKQSKPNIVELPVTHVRAKEVVSVCGIPIAGRSTKPNTIIITKAGIYY